MERERVIWRSRETSRAVIERLGYCGNTVWCEHQLLGDDDPRWSVPLRRPYPRPDEVREAIDAGHWRREGEEIVISLPGYWHPEGCWVPEGEERFWREGDFLVLIDDITWPYAIALWGRDI